eukprot:8493537-Karenia_brevis.AAC.1
MSVAQADITELYSPPRVTVEGVKHKLVPGWACDLTNGWDFRIASHRETVREHIKRDKPLLVIGSPMCTMFSSLQNLSGWSDLKQRRWEEAVRHIEFMAEIYRMQIKGGRWFLHEHPASATSWSLRVIRKLEEEVGVKLSVADQCMYDLVTWSKDGNRLLPARKTTKFMSNCEGICMELQRRCDGSHEHQALLEGRARYAARYTTELCRAICRGLVNEKRKRRMNVKYLCSLRVTDRVGKMEVSGRLYSAHQRLHEESMAEREEYQQAWDDISGKPLNPRQVIEARLVEVDYVKKMGVWIKVTRKEALRRGIKIIGTRWIDVNKGDEEKPLLRS